MSEYQYYEFQAIDRPLTESQMNELRACSTRATITPTRFVNVYNWGDFKGDPSAWMEKHFDAFLYLANWGTHRLMLRLPRRVLDLETARRYCCGESASAQPKGDFVILDFRSDDEEGAGWVDDDEGDPWLSSLIPLRADIASGDYRPLYLAWLLCAQCEELEPEVLEPPVPPGLKQFSASLQAFAEFFRIDDDLIAVAAERSPTAEEDTPREDLEGWIDALPEAEKTALLIGLVSGERSHLRAEILRRFRAGRHGSAKPEREPRGVAELLDAAEHHAEVRRRKEAERAAREKARREREETAARERHLNELAGRKSETWHRVDSLIATKKPRDYDEAVILLKDLMELGARSGRTTEAQASIARIREAHAGKRSFIERLRKAGLIGRTH